MLSLSFPSTVIGVLYFIEVVAFAKNPCAKDSFEYGKCSMTREECNSNVICDYYNLPLGKSNFSLIWGHSGSCITCNQPNESVTVKWSYSRGRELPINTCVFSSLQVSSLWLPECFVNKDLNEGIYTCKSTYRGKTIDRRTYNMTVNSQPNIISDVDRNSYPTTTCPYSFCVSKYSWTFSKLKNGPYQNLPPATINNNSSISIIRMTSSTEGFYKCEAESSHYETVSRFVHITMKPKPRDEKSVTFTRCNPSTCGTYKSKFYFSCYGTIDRYSIDTPSIIFSCASPMKAVKSSISIHEIEQDIQENKAFNVSKPFIELWGNASVQNFEVHILVRNFKLGNEKIPCNFTLREGEFRKDVRSFKICFVKRRLSRLWIYLIASVSALLILISLMMIVIYVKEYEIRFLFRRISASSKISRILIRPGILFINSKSCQNLANDIESFLKRELRNVEFEQLWDGSAGEDLAARLPSKIESTSIAIVFLQNQAFEEEPSLFVDALRQALNRPSIQIMYIFVGPQVFTQPRNFTGVEYLNIDLSKFWSRDRKLSWSSFTFSTRDALKLLKRLRLLLPLEASLPANPYSISDDVMM